MAKVVSTLRLRVVTSLDRHAKRQKCKDVSAVVAGERQGEARLDHRTPLRPIVNLLKMAHFSRAMPDLDLSSQRKNLLTRTGLDHSSEKGRQWLYRAVSSALVSG
jgi:hypothetical protein